MKKTKILDLPRNTLTMIMAGGRGQRLRPLTDERSKPGVPFGANYRIIDFTLSNVWNSGLRHIYILTQYKSYSLDKHLLKGWQIFNHESGEFLYGMPPQLRVGNNWYLGTADCIYQNLFLIERDEPDHVLILSGDHIYRMDYSTLLVMHSRQHARLTVGAVVVPKSEAHEFGILEVDEEGWVIGFEEKPAEPKTIPGKPEWCLVNMGVYVFNRSTLTDELKHDAADPDSNRDFGKNIIPRMVKEGGVLAYPFLDKETEEPRYWRDIGTIDSYYRTAMDLVRPVPPFTLYDRDWPVRTWMAPVPPAKSVHGFHGGDRPLGQLIGSITGGGTIISGGTAERSILGRNVYLDAGCHVVDSVIMDNCHIGKDVEIRHAILDKSVIVPDGMKIGVDREADKRLFTVSDEGVVVVPKGWRHEEAAGMTSAE
jgi:glucose-1-phosphate adenylyltransferase